MSELHHEHDLGLAHDLEVMARRAYERRRVLGLIASGAAVFLGACGGGGGDDDVGSITSSDSGSSDSSSSGSSDSGSVSSPASNTCMVDPTETEGPYPGDGSNRVNGSLVNVLAQSGVVRSDIRSSFGSASGTAEGVLVTLKITVVNVNNSCAPLSGYAVYLWHCTRGGEYSLYASSLLNENYLRGVQATDGNGECTFVTIFPGCYDGRWPHMHFEIYQSANSATSYSNKLLTSQMAMPKETASAVYSSVSGYSASVSNLARVSLSSDMVFGDNTSEQVAWQTPVFSGDTASGYTATITIGVSA
ncbi:MAG: intradiol ring-cleavage dioxygenase [Ottowia sp.]|uniref:dioxygenase family protein n=1 Tax=unclassified Ottowia TaxID=2645081 RepID=UPI003C2D6DB7